MSLAAHIYYKYLCGRTALSVSSLFRRDDEAYFTKRHHNLNVDVQRLERSRETLFVMPCTMEREVWLQGKDNCERRIVQLGKL